MFEQDAAGAGEEFEEEGEGGEAADVVTVVDTARFLPEGRQIAVTEGVEESLIVLLGLGNERGGRQGIAKFEAHMREVNGGDQQGVFGQQSAQDPQEALHLGVFGRAGDFIEQFIKRTTEERNKRHVFFEEVTQEDNLEFKGMFLAMRPVVGAEDRAASLA